jgi:glucan phosphoethanolaminetransferase (alkaline phosphatase superfamily)
MNKNENCFSENNFDNVYKFIENKSIKGVKYFIHLMGTHFTYRMFLKSGCKYSKPTYQLQK